MHETQISADAPAPMVLMMFQNDDLNNCINRKRSQTKLTNYINSLLATTSQSKDQDS